MCDISPDIIKSSKGNKKENAFERGDNNMNKTMKLTYDMDGNFVLEENNQGRDLVDLKRIEAGLINFANQIISENYYLVNRTA